MQPDSAEAIQHGGCSQRCSCQAGHKLLQVASILVVRNAVAQSHEHPATTRVISATIHTLLLCCCSCAGHAVGAVQASLNPTCTT